MIAESKIREKLGRYLRGDLSLDGLEDWLAQSSWNMHKDSNEAAQKLASAIELRLAEHSSGHLKEPALRDELRQFANPAIVQVTFGNVPQVPLPEPANIVAAKARAQVIVFTSRVDSLRPESSPAGAFPAGAFLGGTVSSDKEQLVGYA